MANEIQTNNGNVSLIAPDIARIKRDEDRNVADDLDAVLGRVRLQVFPLAKEKKLIEFLLEDLVLQYAACRIGKAYGSLSCSDCR